MPEGGEEEEEPGLTVNEPTFALINGIIGAGITAVPYGVISPGVKLGIAINGFYVLTVLFTAYLYWLAREHF